MFEKLPLKEIMILHEALKGEIRLVGGCVRNAILGSSKGFDDIDIATPVHPEEVMNLLKLNGIKAIPTGIKYGTVTAIVNDAKFEITTLRKDVACDGRFAEVVYTDVWEEDASRRDFTFNAMYLDVYGNIYDFFGGREDLDKRYLRFIGDPQTRIEEDHLRMLRYFRFYSYFGWENIDQKSFDAVLKNAAKVRNLSKERIGNEMTKLLSSDYVKEALILMNDFAKYLELNYDVEEISSYKFENDPYVNLAAICIKNKNIPDWRFSNKQKEALRIMMNAKISNLKEAREFTYFYGYENFHNIQKFHRVLGEKFDFDGYDFSAIRNKIFPISAKEISAYGFFGKDLGDMIEKLKILWISSDFKMNKDEILNYLKNHCNSSE